MQCSVKQDLSPARGRTHVAACRRWTHHHGPSRTPREPTAAPWTSPCDAHAYVRTWRRGGLGGGSGTTSIHMLGMNQNDPHLAPDPRRAPHLNPQAADSRFPINKGQDGLLLAQSSPCPLSVVCSGFLMGDPVALEAIRPLHLLVLPCAPTFPRAIPCALA